MGVNNPDGGSSGATGTPADKMATPANILESATFGLGYNGSTWDRIRTNRENSDANGILMVTPLAATTRQVGTAAANTAVVLTFPANGNGGWILLYVAGSWSGAAATTGLVTINNGANVLQLDVPLALNSPWQLPLSPGIACGYNTTVTITLAAGGAGAIGKLNAYAYIGQS